MKKISLCLIIALTVLASNAQHINDKKELKRCGVDEAMEELMRRDPGLITRMQEAEKRLSMRMHERFLERKRQGNHRITSTVTIPVVVHIVLPNPNIVTDADVQWQINKMNIDYAGKNADSVNAGPFAASFGHSNIQFCLAQQDPRGNPTNGIVRVTSSRTFTQNNYNLVKYASNCGSDAWDTDQYLNIWVAESADGTLGVATFPNMQPPSEQGVVIALESFGNNPIYTSPAFRLGRTAVHETGHFFFARHIWGDGQNGCNSDFPVVPGLTGSWVDDTPAQSGPTTGCPSGTQPAGCGSPNPPGRMYQNYMDYTNDACYCMFTENQVLRMETALELFRPSLMTSDKCNPPVVLANDASILNILSPGASTGCGAAANTVICNGSITPRITLQNFGSANLTGATIFAQIDNQVPVSTNWTGNLANKATVEVDLTAMTVTPGTHTLTIYVTSPNGSADGRNTNDTLTTSFTVLSTLTAPVTQGFESASFPPAGWRVLNAPVNSLTWERTTIARKSGSASAVMRFFDYGNGNNDADYLLTSPISIAGADSVILSFEWAYQPYSLNAEFADGLAVVISTDCGTTFTEVWQRSGGTLATVPGTTTNMFIPAPDQWANTRIDLKPFAGNASEIIVGFRSTNRFGNNLYLDDINIQLKNAFPIDAALTGIVTPFMNECTRTITPVIQLNNVGSEVLTGGDIVVQLDNNIMDTIHWTGSLMPGTSMQVTGAKVITVPTTGLHHFAAWSTAINGGDDDQPANDTFRLIFAVHDQQQPPVQEGFESDAFPPANWTIRRSGSEYQWERTQKAAAGGAGAAWIRNFRFNSNGGRDDLYSPLTKVDAFDSVVIKFDLAHAMVSPPTLPPDTLEVLLTKDCGRTFTSLYKKWGSELKTTPGNLPPTFPPGDTTGYIPAQSHWRTEYIDITPHLSPGNSFMVVFRNTSNGGNNLFLDNINIQPVLLPEKLKKNGYLIAPSPFTSTFSIRHIEPPINLQAVVVSNAAGQVVFVRRFTGTVPNYLEVNLGHHSSGLYHIRLIYSDKVVSEKILKL